MSHELNRRGFLTEGAGLGALAAGLLLTESGAARAAEPQVVALLFSDYQELAKVGGSAQAALPNKAEIIVARPENDRFVCVAGRCPRDNGLLTYEQAGKQFVCPDCGSRYDLEGKVAKGPGTKPLRCYDASQAVVVKGDKK